MKSDYALKKREQWQKKVDADKKKRAAEAGLEVPTLHQTTCTQWAREEQSKKKQKTSL